MLATAVALYAFLQVGEVLDRIRALAKDTERREDRLTEMLTRFQSASSATPDAMLIVDKQRNGAWEGRIALWFDSPSQQYRGGPNMPAMNFCTFPHTGYST